MLIAAGRENYQLIPMEMIILQLFHRPVALLILTLVHGQLLMRLETLELMDLVNGMNLRMGELKEKVLCKTLYQPGTSLPIGM